MCFSATASFIASGVLGVMGTVSLLSIKQKNQVLFASIPVLFAIQQAAEGVVWLSFNHTAFEPWRTGAMYIFLLFALIVWPVLIPLSLYDLEHRRSVLIKGAIAIGALVSLYLAAGLSRYEIVATVLDCHIRYFLPLGHANVCVSSFLYLCATLVPFFCARTRYMSLFGLLFGLSYAISYFFYYHILLSVWCFFSALLSMSVIVILRHQEWIPKE